MGKMYKLLVVAIALVAAIAIGIAYMVPGAVTITTTPTGATVFIDNKDCGKTTPCTITGIRTGSHSITLRVDKYHDATSSIHISPGAHINATLTLRPILTTGFIALSDVPLSASVLIDGQIIKADTYSSIGNIKPGEHRVEVRKLGYKPWVNKIRVNAEDTVQLTALLEKLPESILCVDSGNMAGTSGNILYAINPNDGQARKIAEVDRCNNTSVCAISPDGETIAVNAYNKLLFYKYTGELLQTVTLERNVAHDVSVIESIQWHPNGGAVLVTYTIPGDVIGEEYPCLAIYDLKHKKFKKIGQDGVDGGACYSPDGKKIAYIHGTEVVIANIDLSANKMISAKIVTAYQNMNGMSQGFIKPPLQWSPDGKSILVCMSRDNSRELFRQYLKGYVLSLEGEIIHEIPELFPGACWSPDGSKIAYTRSGDRGVGIAIYDLNTGGSQTIAEGYTGLQLSWGSLREMSNDPGKVVIKSEPSGEKVFVDGNLTGDLTPTTVTLTPGEHSIQVQDMNGNYSDEKKVLITPGVKKVIMLR